MVRGALVAVIAAALLVIGLGILIYVGIARDRLVPTPTPRPTPSLAPTLTSVPTASPVPSDTAVPLAVARGTVREYSPGALIIVLTPIEGNVEQVIVPENTVVVRDGGERASLREIVPGAAIRAEGTLDDLGRLVAVRVLIEVSDEGTREPTMTPEPTVAPSPEARAWEAAYFGSKDLSGAPALTRSEEHIDHDWAADGPPGLPVDGFSARWTGRWAFEPGLYRFSALSDDGVRVWLNDQLIIDRWVDQAATLSTAERAVMDGEHDLRVEYYESGDKARIRVWWERASEVSGWHGRYYSNVELTGMPSLERSDPEILFDWGRGSPDQSIPVDGFGARWTQRLDLPRGAYRVLARADDGIRILIDERPFIVEWHDSQPETYVAHVWLTGAGSEATVEYFEKAGDANVHVWFEEISEFEGWRGEYHDNAELQGPPVFVRDDESLEMDWRDGSPQTGFSWDNFSVRWRRTLDLAAGQYRFWAEADDGVRVFVDGERVIDAWVDSPVTRLEEARYLDEGEHTVVVEYYERGGEASLRAGWDALDVNVTTFTPTATPSLTTTAPLPTATETASASTPTSTLAPPTETVEPTATVQPTVTVQPTATVEPTATEEPTVTDTAQPTATTQSSDTPIPASPTVAATATVASTDAPSPTETPAPGLTAAPEPD